MSDEFDNNPDNNFSCFWPLLILVIGLFIWSGYQDWAMNKQRSYNAAQFQAALPTINDAQNVGARYVALMKDLVQTAQKDPAAAQIVKDAIKANMIQVQQNATNGTATPVAPTPTPTPSK